MNVLIISDDPKGSTFDQITGLRRTILKFDNIVDLLAFSEEGIFLNDNRVDEKDLGVLFMEPILRRKRYDLVAISLGVDYLRRLFFKNPNILDFLEKHSPETRVYIFGASTLLDQIEKDSSIQLFLYPRHGVAKLTQEFKNDIVGFVKRER